MALLSSLFSLLRALWERLSSLGVDDGRGFCELSRRKVLLVKAAQEVRILLVESRRRERDVLVGFWSQSKIYLRNKLAM